MLRLRELVLECVARGSQRGVLLRRRPANVRQRVLRLIQPRLQFALGRRQCSVLLVRRPPRVIERVLRHGERVREFLDFRGKPLGLRARGFIEFEQRLLVPGQPALEFFLERLKIFPILFRLALRLREGLGQCGLLRLQILLHVPRLHVQIAERLLGDAQPSFEGGLLGRERRVFFRGEKLEFRELPFTVRDPLLQARLRTVERLHFLGRRLPRFEEILHGLRKSRLQFIPRHAQRRVLLGGKPLRLGQHVLRLRETPLDVRLLRTDGTVRLVCSAARFVQHLRDREPLPVQIVVLRGKLRVLPGEMISRLGEQTFRLREAALRVRLFRGDRAMRLRDGLPLRVQIVVLRGKCRLLAGCTPLRLGGCIREFRHPALEFRLRRIRSMPLLLEQAIRLLQACLQLVPDLGEPGAFLARGADRLRARRLHLGQLPPEIVPHLSQREIFLIRSAPRLLQRADRHRETSVDLIPFRRQQAVPGMRLVARLIKCGLHLGQPPIEIRAHLRQCCILLLRRLQCIRHRTLREREPVLQILRHGTQRLLLLASPARGVAHRLVKLGDTTLDLRLFLQKRGPLLVRRSRGLGKRLLARCDLRVRGREFLAHLFQIRGKAVLRLLVPRLQFRQLRRVRGLLGGELGFELLAAGIHLGEPARRLRDLGHQRFPRGVERTGKVLVVRARLGELAHDGFHLPPGRIALRGERREIAPGGYFKFGKRDGHALHLRLGLVALARDVLVPGAQLREFTLHLPHLLGQPLRRGALLGKVARSLLAIGADTREFHLRFIARRCRLFLRIARGRELAAELIDLGVKDRIPQQSLRAGCEARVLFFQIPEGPLRLRKLLRDVLSRVQRRGMFGLDLGRDLLAPRDLTVKADVHGLRLLAQPVALHDERIDLPLQRRALLAQPAGELLPLLEHRLAFTAELRLLIRLMRLQRIELLCQRGDIAPGTAAALDRPLKFANLGILRLRELLERCDAPGGFREALLSGGAFLLLPLPGIPRLRLGLCLDLTHRPFLFRTGRIALLHEHLQPISIVCDFRFQPLHSLQVMAGRVRRARETDFDFRRAQPRRIEVRVDGPVVRLERVHLRLQILQRLAHLDLTVLDAEFRLLPHLLLRRLHVGRGLHLQLVRGGEKFLRL